MCRGLIIGQLSVPRIFCPIGPFQAFFPPLPLEWIYSLLSSLLNLKRLALDLLPLWYATRALVSQVTVPTVGSLKKNHECWNNDHRIHPLCHTVVKGKKSLGLMMLTIKWKENDTQQTDAPRWQVLWENKDKDGEGFGKSLNAVSMRKPLVRSLEGVRGCLF